VPAYRVVTAGPPDPSTLARAATADAVTFMSGRTIEAFLALVPDARDLLERIVVAVVGPVASRDAQRLGVRVDVMPAEATAEAMIAALAEHLDG